MEELIEEYNALNIEELSDSINENAIQRWIRTFQSYKSFNETYLKDCQYFGEWIMKEDNHEEQDYLVPDGRGIIVNY